MSNAIQKQTLTLAERRAAMAEVARQVDSITETGVLAFSGAGGKLAEEITAAQAMIDLQGLLDESMMQPVMGVMNSSLGFLTDRNPEAAWEPKPAYPMPVVRGVFIEARLRGFHLLGNEFNIIGGRFYATVNGFRRRLTDGKTFPTLTEFSDDYSVPDMRGDMAVVKCSASWKSNGVASSVKREFPIRVNKGMGYDAVLGKAQRKLLKVVHDRVSGVATPEGEADGAAQETPPAQIAGPKFTPPSKPEDQVPGAEVPPLTAAIAAAHPGQVQVVSAPPSGRPVQDELADFLISAGVFFDDFAGWLKTTGRDAAADSYAGFNDVPSKVATDLLKDPKALAKCVTLYGKKGSV